MKFTEFIGLIGLTLIFLSLVVALIPFTYEEWSPKAVILKDSTITIHEAYSDTISYTLQLPLANRRNLTVFGCIGVLDEYPDVRESFSLYIDSYVKAENVSGYIFSFPINYSELGRGLKMTIVNMALENITEEFLTDTLTVYNNSAYASKTPLTFPPKTSIVISGRAEEMNGQKFNLYILDEQNFEKWRAGLPFKSYFNGTGKSLYIFTFTVPREKYNTNLYYVVEKMELNEPTLKVLISMNRSYLKPVDIKVQLFIELRWYEKSYAHILEYAMAGLNAGVIGILFLASAIVLHIIQKQQEAPINIRAKNTLENS